MSLVLLATVVFAACFILGAAADILWHRWFR